MLIVVFVKNQKMFHNGLFSAISNVYLFVKKIYEIFNFNSACYYEFCFCNF